MQGPTDAVVRQYARQNLLVATVNCALDRGLIILKPGAVAPACSTARSRASGRLPPRDCGFDEGSIKVMVCPTAQSREFIRAAPPDRQDGSTGTCRGAGCSHCVTAD
jgi:hypothetical protein